MLCSLQVAAMSTLLDIKSSVLRQVQVCPSFRRKTEQENPGTDAQEPATGAWWVPQGRLCRACGPGLPPLAGLYTCPVPIHVGGRGTKGV